MTNRDVFLQILSEASGYGPEIVQGYADICFKIFGINKKADHSLSPEESRKLLLELRNEIPAIRQQLITSGIMAELKLAAAKVTVH